MKPTVIAFALLLQFTTPVFAGECTPWHDHIGAGRNPRFQAVVKALAHAPLRGAS